MRTAIIIMAFLLGSCCHQSTKEGKPERFHLDISKIEMRYIELTCVFMISMGCEEFEARADYDTKIITNKKKINRIMNQIVAAPPFEAMYDEPDTRIKLYIHWKNGEMEPVCIGQNSIFLKRGIFYEGSKELMLLLESMMPKYYRLWSE